MADKALRGRGILGRGRGTTGPSRGMGRSAPKEEMTTNEFLGIVATGGRHVPKPHSTKEGREASGKRHVRRFFGMFKDKKGTPV
tara:strand:- start:46 stop:297 length:252 start_codon:yes stop_codon:yes gene_type:complete